MATERQSPDGLLVQTNLSGVLSAIQDDPDTPDASWLTYITNNVDTVCRVSFPTPTGNPTVGADLQQFKIWVRKQPGTGVPTVRIELYENGVSKAIILADTSVTSATGQLFSASWNANLLGTANGSLAEGYIYGTAVGGAPANRCTVEVGAVEWNVTYDVGGATHLLAGVIAGLASVSGLAVLTQVLAGAISGVASVSGLASIARALAGVINGIASVSGATAISRAMAGAISGIASAAGTLTTGVVHALAGVIGGVASVTGSALITRGLAGIANGIAAVTGATSILRQLAGTVSGIATVTGFTQVTRKLAGAIGGICSILSNLTVSLAGFIPTVCISVSPLREKLALRAISDKIGLEERKEKLGLELLVD